MKCVKWVIEFVKMDKDLGPFYLYLPLVLAVCLIVDLLRLAISPLGPNDDIMGGADI